MFIIWGFGHQTVKNHGNVNSEICGNCNNHINRQMVKITTWFTLFFIPIIPYKKRYLLICPICRSTIQLEKHEYLNMLEDMENRVGESPLFHTDSLNHSQINGGNLSEAGLEERRIYEEKMREVQERNKYAGKTETQIAYLKQMEELEKSRNQND